MEFLAVNKFEVSCFWHELFRFSRFVYDFIQTTCSLRFQKRRFQWFAFWHQFHFARWDIFRSAYIFRKLSRRQSRHFESGKEIDHILWILEHFQVFSKKLLERKMKLWCDITISTVIQKNLRLGSTFSSNLMLGFDKFLVNFW